MDRNVISLMLASILWLQGGLIARANAAAIGATPQKTTRQKPTIAERVTQIPPGSPVKVRLLNKERLRGRLGDVSEQGFNVQVAKGSQIETRKLSFSEAKSIKQVGGKTHTVIYILAGVGIAFAVLLALAFALGRSD